MSIPATPMIARGLAIASFDNVILDWGLQFGNVASARLDWNGGGVLASPTVVSGIRQDHLTKTAALERGLCERTLRRKGDFNGISNRRPFQ
jgi:hypothetical protein